MLTMWAARLWIDQVHGQGRQCGVMHIPRCVYPMESKGVVGRHLLERQAKLAVIIVKIVTDCMQPSNPTLGLSTVYSTNT